MGGVAKPSPPKISVARGSSGKSLSGLIKIFMQGTREIRCLRDNDAHASHYQKDSRTIMGVENEKQPEKSLKGLEALHVGTQGSILAYKVPHPQHCDP